MAARTTRRISQPNSRYRVHIKAALRHSSENNIAQRCYRLRSSPAQGLPRDFIRGQNPNTRSVPDRTACAALPAHRSLLPSLTSRHHPRSPSATTCAAPPAQALPRALFAAKIRRAGRFPTAPLAEFYPRPTASPGNFRSPGSRRRRAKLIYGSAIKTSHKVLRINKLRNSNRR
jgi:hypothetical protein